jgi:hypothetical protein
MFVEFLLLFLVATSIMKAIPSALARSVFTAITTRLTWIVGNVIAKMAVIRNISRCSSDSITVSACGQVGIGELFMPSRSSKCLLAPCQHDNETFHALEQRGFRGIATRLWTLGLVALLWDGKLP